ncbi:MAG: PspA/IM30 family protein, partial [Lachnospiraceae bacterium]|nr:PspA/IM30 family protein [Lachnospiraceae bacterium]
MAFFKKKPKEKDVDDFIIEMIKNYKEVRKAAEEATEEEKKARAELDQCDRQISDLQIYAAKAVQAGNENDARRFLTEKNNQTKVRERVAEVYRVKSEQAQQLRKMNDDLVDKIEDMKARKQSIKATQAEAAAQEAINKIQEMSAKNDSSAKDTLAKLEEQAKHEKDVAAAKAELNKTEKESSMDALQAKYDNMELKSEEPVSVDDELDALQA